MTPLGWVTHVIERALRIVGYVTLVVYLLSLFAGEVVAVARRIRDPRSREQIIEAGWRLVAEHGVGGATMRAIAVEAGVSTGSVTHYFEDKAELMAAVLRYNGLRSATRVASMMGSRRGLVAAERAALALLPVDDERVKWWRVWLAFWSDDVVQDPSAGGFVLGYRAWTKLVERHLGEAVEDGDLPAGLDLRHEVGRLAMLIAGAGLLIGSNLTARKGLQARAKRMLGEHFEALRVRATLDEPLRR